jgi:Cdc6-like AAA superfamily ATPase
VDNEGSGISGGSVGDGNLDRTGGPGDANDAWFSNNQPSGTRFPRKPIIATTATDAPALEDRLGREALVESLAAMLANKEQETPLTIGLFGHWGAGKTSFMAQLQGKLAESSQADDSEFLFSWFNAWEYENTENVAAGLAEEVIAGLLTDGQFDPESEPPYTKKVGLFKRLRLRLSYLWTAKKTEVVRGLVLILFFICMTWIGTQYRASLANFIPYSGQTLTISSLLLLVIFFLKRIIFLWEHPLTVELKTFFKLPSYKKELGEIPEIRQQLKDLCSLRLKERRLVVFIDDLDRCRIQTIAKTFDATRLITHIKNVIVIIGIDERIAFQAMARAYQNYASQKRSKEAVARDYLGKIIQLPIKLSEVSTNAVSSYIQDLFPQAQPSADSQNTEAPQLAEDPQQRQGIPQNADTNDIRELSVKQEPMESKDTKSGPSKRPATQPEPKSSDDRKSPLPESEEEIEAFKILSSLFNISNPRQLLRLRNAYRLLKAMYSQTRSQIDETLSPLHMSVVLFYQEYCATEDGNNRLKAPTKILKRLPSVEQKWGKSTTIQIAEDFLKYETGNSEKEQIKHWSFDLKKWVEICVLPFEKAPNQIQDGQDADP